MYDSVNRLSKGYCCSHETMPLGRTYMYNLEIVFQRAAAVCVILVALTSHRILTGLSIQFDSDQSTEGDGKGRDRTK